MDYQKVLLEIEKELAGLPKKGKVADYIPELANVDASKFGMHLIAMDGSRAGFGDQQEPFSIQSIVKVFLLTLAFKKLGKKLWTRVGVEPSGDPFNSLVQLEYENGIPRNPFINAGALVVCDVLFDLYENPMAELLDLFATILNGKAISINQAVANSEKATGFRNIALINMMRSYGNIKNNIDRTLDFYFKVNAIELSCETLAEAFLFFANHGIVPHNKQRLLNQSQTKRMNAVMLTCGFYDEAGDFSFQVGLPGKSGVGGGIAAVFPGHYSVVVWSPPLNAKGNSALGMRALERLTTKTGLSIF